MLISGSLIFTAGVGENSPHIRSIICEGLDFMGVELDGEKVRVLEGSLVASLEL